MAKILENHAFASRTVGTAKHPWAEWLDGQIRQLSAEDWGSAKLTTMASLARTRAAKLGLKVRISQDSEAGTLILQAYKPEAGEEVEAESQDEQEAPEAEATEEQEAEEPATEPEPEVKPQPKAGRRNRGK